MKLKVHQKETVDAGYIFHALIGALGLELLGFRVELEIVVGRRPDIGIRRDQEAARAGLEEFKYPTNQTMLQAIRQRRAVPTGGTR